MLSGIIYIAKADSLSLSPVTFTPGENSALVFSLDNQSTYYGFQADITLPAGVTPATTDAGALDMALGSRFGSGYQVYGNTLTDGTVRVGTFSMNHTPISGSTGELFTLNVNVSEDFKGGIIKVTGIKFIDSTDKDVNFPPITLSTTVGAPSTSDSLYIENFSIMEGETKEVAIQLANENSYTAFQTDISLSPNLTIVPGSFSTTTRTANHELNEKTGGGATRVTCMSSTNAAISGTSGPILTFSVTAAKATGNATITLSNNLFTSTTIQEFRLADSQATATIVEPYVTSISLNKTELTLQIPGEETLIPTILPANAVDKNLVWDSTDPGKATVDQNGKVTAVAIGTTKVKVYSQAHPEAYAECVVNVVPTLASEVVLSSKNITLLVGSSTAITATVLPENTTDKSVVWSSQNEGTAKYEDGKVIAVSAGTTELTATCGNVSASCTVTVKALTDVTVKPGDGTGEGDEDDTPGSNTEDGGALIGNDLTLRVGQTANISLQMPEDLAETPAFDWQLGNGGNKYVTMHPADDTLSAAFTGLSVGATSYTVSFNGKEVVGGKVIVIAETPVESLMLTPAEISMARNALPETITAEFQPANASIKTLQWTSSNPNVASVSDGVVTPIELGETTIIATTTDGSGMSATCKVTVTAPIDENFDFDFDEEVMGGVDGIEIYIGTSYTIKPKAQEGHVLPAEISWTSDRPSIVSVDANGKVTGLALGDATITASAVVNGQPVSASCKVTVKPVPLTGVSITAERTPTLFDGETLQLTARTTPTNATEPIEIQWSSANPDIATVDGSGLVTAHSEIGTVVITATANNPANEAVSGTFEVTVIATGAGRVILNASNLTMLLGQKDKLTATVDPETTTDKTVTWSSDNSGIASVDSEGNITAVSAGMALITATCGKATAQCTVTVKDGGDITVTPGPGTGEGGDKPGEDDGNGFINGTDVTVHVNRTVTMNLTMPDDLTALPTLTWTLADGGNQYVTLTPTGNTLSATFTGVKVGNTSYTVSLNGKALFTGNVKVVAEVTMKSLELDPASISMAQNALAQTITPVYTPQEATMPEFNWTSSDPTVASVSNNGVVSPLMQGQATITATALDGSDLSATCEVTVTAPIDEDFEFDESVMGGVEGVTIFLGDSYVLKPKAHEGFVLPSNIVWSSSDDRIVSVDQNGKVTGNSLGSATIFATAVINGNEITASCTVNVVPIKVASIHLSQTSAELRATETLKLSATIEPDNATDKTLQWTTNAPSIVSVSQDGVVTAHMVGEANITARATDGSNVSANCTVKVVPTVATGITVTADGTTTLKATETVQLTATVTPATTTDKSVTWKSDKPDIASVSESGVVTAVAVGEANITATNSAGQSSTIKITVIPTLVETIELNRYTAQIRVQGSFRLTANIYPLTATDKSVTWTSSNSQIVSVDNEGNVLGIGLGEAQIICTANDGSGVSVQCRVTVTTTATQSVSVSANGSTMLKASETVQLTATVLPETATDKSVRWQSDNTDIATVDNQGLVTAVSVGTASITATNSGGQTASITITVVPTPVERIELSKSAGTLKATETLTLIATVYPETATQKGIEWSSSDETIAMVTQSGLVTAVAKGEAVITAKAVDGSGVTATCKISVIATDVTSIKITANGSTTLKAAETLQLTATVLPETATDKSVRWSSASPEIADINENGLVTAYAVGKTTITASASSGLTDEITITVEPTLVSSIILNQPSITMRVTNEIQLSATILPTTATDKSLTWTSSNANIASVDAGGKVTAVKEGQASIICTANDGSGVAATCIVNVVDTDVEIVTISADGPTTLKVSETVQLRASIQPETTTDKSITWSSGNESVATVDTDGLVTAVSEGHAVITATTSNGLKDQITITVVDTQVSSITLNETTIILMANETYSLIPNIQPQTATNKQLLWATGDAGVAYVAQDGIVTAVAVGETTVTASATDGSGVFASCKVTVIPTPAESITITVVGNTTLEINQTVQLTAEVLPANATDKSVVWTSSNTTVAEVTENGLVTALTAGEAVITATNSAGQYDRVTIIVLSNEPDQPDVPDVPVKRADTPTEMLRKGDGTSHTFVAMMEKSDVVLETEGYHYVFGYTDTSDNETALEDTPRRYTYTTEDIYWNSSFDFWVFAYYLDAEGTLYVSSRRHLDGGIDDGFDPMKFIGSRTRSSEHIVGVYTVDGQFLGKDLESLDSGIYVIKTTKSSYKVIK